nr:ero1-like protein [Lepeophtheirus salmonis]
MQYSEMRLVLFLLICMSFLQISGGSWGTAIKQQVIPEDGDQCFCELKGRINDCSCTVESVDHFNNIKIFPRMMSILTRDYFRYFRYNAKKPCPFWKDMGKCKSSNCGVRACSIKDLPEGILAEDSAKANGDAKRKYKESTCSEEGQDNGNAVDDTISEKTRSDLEAWNTHDESVIDFCDRDEEYCPDCDYVDLTLNPERFTGYDGEASHRIWRAIYEENCFRPTNVDFSKGFKEAFLHSRVEKDMCLEKRAFYRALSGLHTSITIHLCANYLLSKNGKGNLPVKSTWGPNLEEFISRFDPKRTKNQGPHWLKNLYFVYLLELRAITKASDYLSKQLFYTGNEEEDKDTQIAIKEILNLLRSFPSETFDETTMFATKGTEILKSEFRNHFHNITRLMDCVECDKCKLWGKLQITGLGTALKLLFSDTTKENFYLTRNEIVALFNAFGRISTSIQQVEKFRKVMRSELVL